MQSSELKNNMFGIKHLSRTYVIPQGFNGRAFHPTKSVPNDKCKESIFSNRNDIVIIFCGVLAKIRNLNCLIQAISISLHQCNNAKAIIIGEGDAMEEITCLVESLSLNNRIIFTGWINHDDLPHYYRMADIGISYVPNQKMYTYNPPTKTFEYLACGLPVVATNTVSNTRIIRDGFNGLLANDHPADIARCIIKLVNKVLF
jgi:glycosyltransferase involved in cell wall biosynthesis